MNFSHLIHVAWFTFFQAACSTLMALMVGLPAAFFCGRRRFAGRRALLSLSAVPFCVPSLIIALGYVTFLGLNGGLNQFLMFVFGFKEPPVKILYSFAGLIIAHGFYNFPLIMKNVSDAWERLPSEPAECARLLGAKEGRIFRTVTIFQLMPSIASSCMLVFIYCFLSFILVLLFGGVGNTTLEVEIYKTAKASLDFPKAGLLALFETFILCLVTTGYCVLENKTAAKTKGLKSENSTVLEKLGSKGFVEILIFLLLIIAIITFFVAPLFGIVINAFTSSQTGVTKGPAGITLRTFNRVVKMRTFVPAVKNTISVACFTGLFCTICGFFYSVLLRFLEDKVKNGTKIFLKVLPMIPMSVSSVVMGILITMVVHKGNVVSLIFAQTLLSWPLAFRVIYPQLTKISSQTLDSAKMVSRNKVDIIWRVIFPLCKRSLLAAFGFCFAVSAGDTTLPLVLGIPKFDTLSLFTYRLAGAYRFNEACASGMILGVLCALVFLGSSLINKKYKRNNGSKKCILKQ